MSVLGWHTWHTFGVRKHQSPFVGPVRAVLGASGPKWRKYQPEGLRGRVGHLWRGLGKGVFTQRYPGFRVSDI